MQVNAFAAFISVLISAILGFGLSILAERRFRHLYTTSIKIIRYSNFCAFLLIGLGLTQIFNEISQFITHGYSIRAEVIYGAFLVYATIPLVIFIATFGISVLNKKIKNSNQPKSIPVSKSIRKNSELEQPEEVLSRVTNHLIVAAFLIGASVYIYFNFSNQSNVNNNSALPLNSSSVILGDRTTANNYNASSGNEKLQEEKWILTNKNNLFIYVDIGNIKRKGKGGSIWLVFQYRDIGSDNSVNKVLFEIDCENKITRGIGGGTSYKSLDITEFHAIPLEKWNTSPWVPLDVNEPYQQQMFNFVCNK